MFRGPRHTYVVVDELHHVATERLERIHKKVQTARVLAKIRRRNTSAPPKRG